MTSTAEKSHLSFLILSKRIFSMLCVSIFLSMASGNKPPRCLYSWITTSQMEFFIFLTKCFSDRRLFRKKNFCFIPSADNPARDQVKLTCNVLWSAQGSSCVKKEIFLLMLLTRDTETKHPSILLGLWPIILGKKVLPDSFSHRIWFCLLILLLSSIESFLSEHKKKSHKPKSVIIFFRLVSFWQISSSSSESSLWFMSPRTNDDISPNLS